MDLGSTLICVYLMMVCLLGAARCSIGGENKCKCQEIPRFTLTEDPLSTCSNITTAFRYTCIEGYVRKAGTSNRITCNQADGKWTTPSLQCIPDPKGPQPPKTTVTQGYTDFTLDIITTTVSENKCKCQEIPQFPLTEDPSSTCSNITTAFRYTCIEGYVRKAGTSNRITCNQVNGSWTTPSLQCIPASTSPPVILIASTSVTAETERTVSTSSALQSSTHKSPQGEPSLLPVISGTTAAPKTIISRLSLLNPVTKTEETKKSTSISTTTEPSTINPRVLEHTKLSDTSTALITLAMVMIVCALIGLTFKKCYRRPKENTCHQPSEEELPMNTTV